MDQIEYKDELTGPICEVLEQFNNIEEDESNSFEEKDNYIGSMIHGQVKSNLDDNLSSDERLSVYDQDDEQDYAS